MGDDFLEALARCALFFGACTLIGLAFGYALERHAWSIGRKVYDVPAKKHQLRTEIVGTIVFHLVWLPVAALLLWSGALRFSNSIVADLVTLPFCWLSFQGMYYALHRAMHSKRLFWIHRWHHESLVTSPMTGLSMHPLEALGWSAIFVVSALALSAAGLLGERGWIVFFVLHFVGNVAGHANAEIFPLRATRLSSILWSNPIVYHSMHHARFDGHYGFAAAIFDRAFGTEWPDWHELHAKIMDGRPLRSLREKGASIAKDAGEHAPR